jgi:hypothetical protein
MAQLKVRCISTSSYLNELPNGSLVEGQFEDKMISSTLNKVYDALEDDGEYYRIIDNTNEVYIYPKM